MDKLRRSFALIYEDDQLVPPIPRLSVARTRFTSPCRWGRENASSLFLYEQFIFINV